jgi:hypothetical protein
MRGNGDSIRFVRSVGVMNGFPRERDSNLIRFPFSGNLINKLCALCELERQRARDPLSV